MKRGSVVVGFLDGGHWSACFGLSYRDLCLYDMGRSQRIVRQGGRELRSLCSSGGIVAGRNTVAAQFLDQTDGEWLFSVDSDMGFAPDTVDRLVESADPVARPVVGGLCFALHRKPGGDFYSERNEIVPTLYEYLEFDEGREVGFRPLLDYKRDEVQQVAGTGAACILIHRSVLYKIREARGDVWFDQITHPTGGGGAPRTFSEDLSFCIRCQAVGVPIHVDTSVKTCHEKGGVFLDEWRYDRERGL